MRNILCQFFGHIVGDVDTGRAFSICRRCSVGLKLSYDMSYGDTVVVGDYGEQTTFAWCDCGNELCSSGSHTASGDVALQAGIEFFRCSRCGKESKWMFDAPVPIKLT